MRKKGLTILKINEVILQSITKVVVFIILTLGFYLFFSGHHAPGGGFIGGLVFASAFVLLLLAYDIETVRTGIPVNFRYVAALGTFIVLLSGIIPTFFGEPFLQQTIFTFELPLYGPFEFSTVTFFESGVALTVVGVVVTIILKISEDVE